MRKDAPVLLGVAMLLCLGASCSRDDASETADAAKEAAGDVSDAAQTAGARLQDVVDDFTVKMVDTAFEPKDSHVKLGQEVTWRNEDSRPHSVVADNMAFESETLGQGTEFSFRFTQAGEYPYHCGIHGATTMSGTVTVTT